MPTATTNSGSLPSGSTYLIEVPERWNGTLLLHSHPVPVGPGEPPWHHGDPLIGALIEAGYAVAGSANTIFWPLETVLADHPALIGAARSLLGAAEQTIASGVSIGGIISAARVQRFPEDLTGALPMCGNLAGAVGTHNRELDIAFVITTLLDPGSQLELVRITRPGENLRRARLMLHEARSTPTGRARLALAAAVGNIPGWHDPLSTEPVPGDVEARQHQQFEWFRDMCFLVYFWAREQVERQAGGNPSWNTHVDYRDLLAASDSRDVVEALYGSAEVDLDDDLDRLASAARVDADLPAVAYLERHIIFDGDLGGMPVLTMHTAGDGLVTPDHQHAYADVVQHAGNHDLLRQLYVRRGGHCTFTSAEILTALDRLIERIESGRWPDIDPEALNRAATQLGPGCNTLGSGDAIDAGFSEMEPPPFQRRYDSRDVAVG